MDLYTIILFDFTWLCFKGNIVNYYNTLLWLHITSAFLLLAPSVFMPILFGLYKTKKGQQTLKKIHMVIGIGGWTLLISGIVMLYLQHGAMLSCLWMQFSLVLFVLIQAIDHFWADKQEENLEHGVQVNTSKLKIWMITKVLGYGLIAILMVVQPCLK